MAMRLKFKIKKFTCDCMTFPPENHSNGVMYFMRNDSETSVLSSLEMLKISAPHLTFLSMPLTACRPLSNLYWRANIDTVKGMSHYKERECRQDKQLRLCCEIVFLIFFLK